MQGAVNATAGGYVLPVRKLSILLAVITAVVILGALAAWLSAPADIQPRAWIAPPDRGLVDRFEVNDRLARGELWAKELRGPEAITFDRHGALITGTADGALVRLSSSTGSVLEVLGNTGGRPLGLEHDHEGRLIICDAHRGLLAQEKSGALVVLVAEHGGVPFRFTDDLEIAKDGTIYFTDASSRRSVERFTEDLIEHHCSGRLLSHHPATGKTELLLDGLCFANGVALSEKEDFLLVVETGAYRIQQYWLTGPLRGQARPFVENLPGFPDNITRAPSGGIFWVAIGSPRNRLIDALAGWPEIRRMITGLPQALHPRPEAHGIAIALDDRGQVVANLQHRAPDAYAPVASVIERDGVLYLGSFAKHGIWRILR